MEDVGRIDRAALLRMNFDQLEALFRASSAGSIPSGEFRGALLLAPGAPFNAAVAGAVERWLWRGKCFDRRALLLRNRLSPFDLRAVTARVTRSVSRLDAEECLVFDYSRTAMVARFVRDEAREVAEGVYLGRCYVAGARLLYFCLEKVGGASDAV